jgi:D-alanine-D-alanine ligase
MRICILHPSYEGSQSPAKAFDCNCDPAYYLAGHTCENHFLYKGTSIAQVEALARQDFDVFVNLCDGAAGEDRPGIEVVQALERCRVAFTGAGSHFFEPTRPQLKAACRAAGVASPAWAIVQDTAEAQGAAQGLRFPLIVKHPNSYGSIGLTRDSRVEHPGQLRRQVERMAAAYGGALIEEFIEGREYTVLVAENPEDPYSPVVYPPAEFRFPNGETFKHFGMKWMSSQYTADIPCDDPALAARLEAAAAAVFLALNGNSYARVDLRVDERGELFVLDVNPNCGLFYPPGEEGSADLILLRSPGGHAGFLALILQAAIQRRFHR